MRKHTDNIRVYREDKLKLRDITIDLTNIQREKISFPETLRRVLNIPNIKDQLKLDAEIKRRFRK